MPSEPEPGGNAAPPDWLEAARQAFLWRYFYDDCGRSDPGIGIDAAYSDEREAARETPSRSRAA
jgi:hypothetical protein